MEAAPLLARLKLSGTTTTSLFAKIITMGGGRLKDFALSRSTVRRQRIAAEYVVAKKMDLKFEIAMKEFPFVVLHWDAKKVIFKSNKIDERLAICVQNVTEETQHFVGAPEIPDGTGISQCDAIVRYIDNTGIEDQLIGQCRFPQKLAMRVELLFCLNQLWRGQCYG